MNDMQVGRNDPCPCGSGKKFKRCCLQSPNFHTSAAPARFSFQPAQRAVARHAPPPQMAGAFDNAPPQALGDEPDAPEFHTVPLLPVEVGLHYTYPEPFGQAEVSYIFPGGKFFLRQDQTPVCVDDLKVGDRIVLKDDNIATITEVQFYYEPPEPPTVHADGQLFSRVIGTVKHMAPAVLDVKWAGYTASNTPGHRYYSVTRQDYVPAYDLRVGELLRTDDNLVTPVLSVSAPRYGLIDVYNMEVEHYHNYYVGSGKGNAVLVHNGIPGGAGCISTPKEVPNPHLEGKTPLAGTRRTGVLRAARLEIEMVQRTGKGTMDWTAAEIQHIQKTGTLPDNIVGHHINNVAQFPEWAGDPRNIMFVRGQQGNLAQHGGNV